ncbi:MAG: FtsX-like permease family protein [Thermoplasmata archaeon]|nr:FtsX-like permease family protein [Thermoplasmata archaeon]
MPLGGYIYRAFRSNRRRNAMGIAAVVVTVFLMVLVGVLFNVVMGTLTETFTREAGHDIQVTPTVIGTANLTNVSYLDIDYVTGVLERDGVESIHPLFAQVMLAYPTTGTVENATFTALFGTEEDFEAGTVLEMEGEYDLQGDGCVISSESARYLEIGVGDEIEVIGYRGELNLSINFTELLDDPDFQENLIITQWTVNGIIDVRGRFYQGVSTYIVKDLAKVQELYNITGQANLMVGMVDPKMYDLNNPQNPAEDVFILASDIALDLGPGYTVLAPKATAIEASLEASRATTVMAYIFSILFPIIAGIMIASILNLSVEERAKDLATMRLLGARRWMIGRVVAGELALMLLVGIPIGVALGVGVPYLFHWYGVEVLPEDFSRVVDWGVVMGQVLITLAITSLFAMTPLRKAMDTSPAEAISVTRTEGRYRFVSVKGVDKRMLVGAFLMFIALLYATFFIPYFLIFVGESQFFSFFIFSFLIILFSYSIWMLVVVPLLQRGVVALMRPILPNTYKLVRANLERYLRRNASTTLIFAIIVAILLFFSSFFAAIFQSIERAAVYEIGSDILMLGEDGLPLSMVESIGEANNTEDVASSTPELEARLSNVVFSRTFGTDVYAAFGDLTKATFVSDRDVYRGELHRLSDIGPDGCVISRGLATAMEVSLGETVALDFEGQRLFLEIVLILESMPGFAGEFPERPEEAWGSGVFVSLGTYAKLAGTSVEDLPYERVFIMVAEGEDHEVVGRTIQQRYQVFFSFFLIVSVVIIEEIESGLGILDQLFFIILVILMLVAFFSLAMNLMASILEREFELGILRSLGLRRGALRNALVAEGVAISMVAMFVGLVVGVTMSALVIWFFNTLSPIDFEYAIPWWTVGSLFVITVVLSIIATWRPAKRVASKDIVDMLRRAT